MFRKRLVVWFPLKKLLNNQKKLSKKALQNKNIAAILRNGLQSAMGKPC
jgi:hypothetical protein